MKAVFAWRRRKDEGSRSTRTAVVSQGAGVDGGRSL